MTAAPGPGQPDPEAAGAVPAAGLRERKKQRTRLALIDAALDLFLRKGYEETTIDEIVAAVEVSQRTFFRYFATKEDVVTAFLADFDQVLITAVRARPSAERPFTALVEAMRAMLRAVAETGPDETGRFRRVQQVVEANPSLMAAQMARFHETEETLARVVAEREGVDPGDPRAALIVAFHSAAIRVAFDQCARLDVWDPAAIARRMTDLAAVARETMRDWT
ncbi:TetR family transcriptional regulator [Actinomadura rayongensis]|uniref:TetR family transcriptional regulator n=1 Tax=Actinomadura rayongensis TaxID=1429076 RepID=A0A6I4W8I4_9ACTN|nr:TetR family transcriptional regulator [Actinomadura rayongensis]MXQ65948.1 TetR family transcriptional regulator [Actinomadura rayongensis]